jgi:enediyne biosynthesis protein E4
VLSGGSYGSSSDQRLHFGLGSASKAQVEIRWPSGAKENVSVTSVDTILTIREGQGVIASSHNLD